MQIIDLPHGIETLVCLLDRAPYSPQVAEARAVVAQMELLWDKAVERDRKLMAMAGLGETQPLSNA